MSSLKSAIVVVNQYTIRTGSSATGSTGSKGGSPGAYITRYMAREMATEPVTARRGDLDDFVNTYMARSDAVEELIAEHRSGAAALKNVPESHALQPSLKSRRSARSALRRLRRKYAGADTLKDVFAQAQGDGGVAFGHGGVSLSHDSLHADAAMVQRLFDQGKTVHKTVLSFDHEYLVANGLLPDDVPMASDGHAVRGGYRGRLDQYKLRMAVMNGMETMARTCGFDDLRYVGVIQVDTSHVHAHLAIVDAGTGRLAADGTQKGKLSAREISMMRRGTDSFLDRHAHVAHLSSAVGLQRRSVSAYVRRWAYESVSTGASAQFVLACLPDKRTLWRAGTHRTEMSKANRVVREMVLTQLDEPSSPMPAAMAQVTAYADERTAREGLSATEREGLINTGREKIITQAMNGVYSVLAAVPADELTVRTPMLGAMSVDFDELVEQVEAESTQSVPSGATPMSAGQFALRLRAYSERLRTHRVKREEYAVKLAAYEDAAASGYASADSSVMGVFYRTEMDYHGRCVSKYQHFLDFAETDTSSWRQEWTRVEEYGTKLTGLRALRGDRSIAQMKDERAAERIGRELYDQSGGALLARTGAEGKAGRAVLDSRIETMGRRYTEMVDSFVTTWQRSGTVNVQVMADGAPVPPSAVVLSHGSGVDAEDVHTPGAAVIATTAPEHSFELVKGVDMHEMGVDSMQDQPVGRRTAQRFTRLTQARRDAAEEARAWLVATGQGDEVDAELGSALTDCDAAEDTSASVATRGVLPSLLARAAAKARATRRALLAAVTATEATDAAARERHGEVVLDAHARELADAAREHGLKPAATTTRLDSGLGPAITEAVGNAVRSYRSSPLPGE